MVAHPWSEISNQPISEDIIRELFPFAEGYRFFPNRYDAGVNTLPLIARPMRLYVFEGECSYRSEAGAVRVKAAEYVDLPPGEYEFEVLGDIPVRLMNVFKMPPARQVGVTDPNAHPADGVRS